MLRLKFCNKFCALNRVFVAALCSCTPLEFLKATVSVECIALRDCYMLLYSADILKLLVIWSFH